MFIEEDNSHPGKVGSSINCTTHKKDPQKAPAGLMSPKFQEKKESFLFLVCEYLC